jgi:hypothetical protein
MVGRNKTKEQLKTTKDEQVIVEEIFELNGGLVGHLAKRINKGQYTAI